MSSFSDCCLTSGQHLCWIKKVEKKGVKRWETEDREAGVELSRRGRGKRNLNFCFLFCVGNYDWDGVKGRDGWKRAFSREYIDEENFVAGEVKILWNSTILLELILERATSACFLNLMKLRGSHGAIIFWPWMSFKWAKPSYRHHQDGNFNPKRRWKNAERVCGNAHFFQTASSFATKSSCFCFY